MKILFAAPVTFDRITFFISEYIVGLARAARTLGHEVRIVQTTENIYPRAGKFLERELDTLRKYCKWLADLPHDLLLMSQIYQEVKDFKTDVLFIHLIDTSYLPFIINKIKQRGTRVMVWLGVHPSQTSPGIHKLLKSSDITLIYDPSYIDYYQNQLKINNIQIIPLGCDIGYYESVSPNKQFKENNGVDVCFVGIFDEHRERYLRGLSEFNLGIWSWNIGNYETLLQKFYKGVIYGENLIRLLKSSKIVVNIHRDFEISGGNYRLFEIPACGAFQIVDEKKDIGKYFEIGKEIVTFKDENDLGLKVKYYLEHPEERQRIANAGYERVKKDHTLVDRMEKIIKIAESNRS